MSNTKKTIIWQYKSVCWKLNLFVFPFSFVVEFYVYWGYKWYYFNEYLKWCMMIVIENVRSDNVIIGYLTKRIRKKYFATKIIDLGDTVENKTMIFFPELKVNESFPLVLIDTFHVKMKQLELFLLEPC